MRFTTLEKGEGNWFQITQVVTDPSNGGHNIKTIRLQRGELSILKQEIDAALGDVMEA